LGFKITAIILKSYFEVAVLVLLLLPLRVFGEASVLRGSVSGPASEVEEYVILAPKNKGSLTDLIEVRKQSHQVSEVLAAEQMSRQGDSDVASSLRRVTGLTLMSGKYIYVRGLGERYSAVQMNGFSVPSPEPARRVVPLDLFPASLLESVIVQKSFSADLPAEFGGGLVQLKTRSIPEQLFAQITLGENLGLPNEVLAYSGGSSDLLAKDDGTRALPAPILNFLKTGQKIDSLGIEEQRGLGQSLKKNYNIYQKKYDSLPSFNLALGNQWSGNDFQMGAVSSIKFSSENDFKQKITQAVDVPSEGKLEVTQKGISENSEMESRWTGTLDLGLKIKEKAKLNAHFTQLRHATDQVSIQEKSGSGVNDYSRKTTQSSWVERHMSIQQWQGEYDFSSEFAKENKLLVRWGKSQAERFAPDNKEYTYKKTSAQEPYRLDPEASGNLRTYGELQDFSEESGIEYSFRTENLLGLENHWKMGGGWIQRGRFSEVYRLQYVKDYLSGQEPDLERSPDQIFSEGDKWVLRNQTEGADSYRGQQRQSSVYLQSNTKINNNWSMGIGGRGEWSHQDVKTFFYYAPAEFQSRGGLETFDLLPAYSVNWSPSDALRVRWIYGETVSRPDFRELSTSRYLDDQTGYEAMGNAELKTTIIQNLDHRWEYYFSEDEYVSLGVFHKKFISPIEEVFLPIAGTLLKVPKNALSATNRGYEIEFRQSMRGLSRDLRRWSLFANFSQIDSQVELDPASRANLTSQNRPMQGQSPYVINLQIQYDRPVMGTQATLLLNQIGERISEVGTDLRPDIIEKAYPQVDFVIQQNFRKKTKFQFKVKNILDPDVEAYQGPVVVRSYKNGTSYALGLTMNM